MGPNDPMRIFALTLKTAALLLCLALCFSGAHPPAHAQLSSEDAVQDTEIAGINKHLENTDRVADLQAAQLNTQAVQIGEIQTEGRIFFAILGCLVSGSIFVQVKVKKAA